MNLLMAVPTSMSNVELRALSMCPSGNTVRIPSGGMSPGFTGLPSTVTALLPWPHPVYRLLCGRGPSDARGKIAASPKMPPTAPSIL